jgi:hypothetical protein
MDGGYFLDKCAISSAVGDNIPRLKVRAEYYSCPK